MKIIAITGSIASGKSTLLRMCNSLGLATINSDQLVHRLLSPGGAGLRLVAMAFPRAVTKQGIDRQKLAAEVYADKKKLLQLEAILHPLVRAETSSWVRSQHRQGRKAVAIEIPLLFESGTYRYYSFIITTKASESSLRTRALARQDMNPEKLRAILLRQWPQEKKAARSHAVIYTGLGKASAMRQLKALLITA